MKETSPLNKSLALSNTKGKRHLMEMSSERKVQDLLELRLVSYLALRSLLFVFLASQSYIQRERFFFG